MKATRFPGVKSLGARRYLIRAEVKNEKTGQIRERKRIVEDCPDAAAANKLRDAMVLELAGAAGARERVRLSIFLDTWIAHKKPTLAPSTLDRYVRTLTNHVLPALGNHYLDTITHADAVAWRNAQEGEPATVNSRLRILRTAMADAVIEHELPRDPTLRVAALPVDGYSEEAPNSLDARKLSQLLDAVREHAPRWYALFAVLAFTGARVGEVTALRWEDVVGETLLIRRSHWKGRIRHTTKTKKWRRVPVPEPLAAILADHRRWQLEAQATGSDAARERARLGIESGWMFPSSKGTPKIPSAVRNALLGVIGELDEQTGKEGRPALTRVTVHGLRRTMNNLLRQAVGDDKTVMRAVIGHVTERMSEHYSHVSQAEKALAVGNVVAMVRRPKPALSPEPEVLPEVEPAKTETGA